MGSGGRNREQQNYFNNRAIEQNSHVMDQSPEEQAYREHNRQVLAWENQPGHDIADLPGMGDFVQIGQAAINRANRDKMGNGALQLADGGSSGFAQQLKEQKRNELGQEVGAGLENARAQIIGEAHGSVMPFAQLDTSRRLGQLNNTSQMFGMWNQRQSKNWWDYVTDTARMATGIGGAFFNNNG